MSKKNYFFSKETIGKILTYLSPFIVLVISICYTNYKFNEDSKTKLLVICNIPSSSIGYSAPQLDYLNFDVICRVTNISIKKISIDKIESGNTDDIEQFFNSDETRGITYSRTGKAEFPQLLDINQQERYLVQVRLPLYGNKNAQSCLSTTKQEINYYAKCFLDKKFSVDTFSNNIERFPNLAIRVITTDQEKFISKISLKNSFYFYNKKENTWNFDLSNTLEQWPYPIDSNK